MSKPTILLVTGCLTTTACYDFLVPHLEQAGYPVALASLPSSNPEKPYECTAAKDGQHLLHNHLMPLVNAGKDVIVFAHSFGATSLSGAGDKLSKQERAARGLSGGVLGLIYIAFAMVPDGQSQLDYLGGGYPPFVKVNHPSQGLFLFDIDALFNDAEPDQRGKFAKGQIPHSVNVIETPVSAPLWTDRGLDGRRVMIQTMLDAVFPSVAQQTFADNCGVDWKTVPVDGGHEAFMVRSQPADCFS